jgi:nitrogen-specific signal transduction histidine kinase
MPRPRKKGSITKTENAAVIEKGDNSNFVSKNLMIMQLGETKVDLDDPEEVRERISQFFQMMIELDSKPTMTGLSMALGYDHKRITEIINNLPLGGMNGAAYKLHGYTTSQVPKETRELICTAVDIMKSLWEDYMLNGKVHPACGIFYGKNFFGMKDEVEHIVNNNTVTEELTAEDIAKRYLQDNNG